MNRLWCLGLAFTILPFAAKAQIISNSAVEVEYSFRAKFLPNWADERFTTPLQQAGGKSTNTSGTGGHADYIFGILASKEMIRDMGLVQSQVGGLGAPRFPRKITILSGNARSEIEYEVKGRMIMHKDAAKKWLAAGGVNLPLPYDMTKIYDEKCTDSLYDTIGDYWYFYDPYRKEGGVDCTRLSKEPIAKNIFVKMTAARDVKLDNKPHFDRLRGANGNGEDLVIYLMTGFNSSSENREDYGRRNDTRSRQHLVANGFTETFHDNHPRYPRHKYEKLVEYPDGKRVNIVVHTQLAQTDAALDTVTFAEYFYEAVANADVFIYDGHSGLGANLDLAYLQQKIGKSFKFRKDANQLFFFNSCSSYSYYMDMFVGKKTSATIDVITTGLESDFDVSIKMHETLLEEILQYYEKKSDIPTWTEVLGKMEKPIPGAKGSYLLNVGGVRLNE